MRALGLGAVVAAVAVVAACTAGEPTPGAPARTTTAAQAPTSSSSVVAPTSTTATAGTVTLALTGATVPEVGSAGRGIRLLVRAASPRLTVARTGGRGAVTVCPVAGATAPSTSPCGDVGPGGTVEVTNEGGVELRAVGAPVTVEELTITYAPARRSTTVVVPPRFGRGCAPGPCRATLALRPGRPGPFLLDGQGGGGRPRLTLLSTTSGGGPPRTLAVVEGGGPLSIRGTVEAGAEAVLVLEETGADAPGPVTVDISWP